MTNSMELPEGVEFQEGLDGLILGITIVFLVKIQRPVRQWLDWQLIPEWTYRPFNQGYAALVEGLANIGNPLLGGGGGFLSGVGDGGASGAGSGAAGGSASSMLNTPILGEMLQVAGLPIFLFDAFSASAVEQLLIVVGWWIAVLVPLRWWVVRPTLFWWRSERAG